jgi:uncharacterized protein
VRVAWDEAKNLANRRKHGISFEEAAELFASSSDYLEIFDEAHSESEDRSSPSAPLRMVSFLSCGRCATTIRLASSVLAGPVSASNLSTAAMWMDAND